MGLRRDPQESRGRAAAYGFNDLNPTNVEALRQVAEAISQGTGAGLGLGDA